VLSIKISEIQIIPVKPKDGLIAFASFVLNECIYVGNVAIYTSFGEKEYRLVYPAKSLPNGKQINSVHPITREAGELIYDNVITIFKELADRHGNF